MYTMEFTPWERPTLHPAVKQALAAVSKPADILDVGCGSGIASMWLAAAGHNVTGVDNSDIAIGRARQISRAADIHTRTAFHRAEFLAWEPPGMYDMILDAGYFVGVPTRFKSMYVNRVSRLLRPNGQLLVYSFPPRIVRGTGVGLSLDAVEELFQSAGLSTKSHDEHMWLGLAATWSTFQRDS